MAGGTVLPLVPRTLGDAEGRPKGEPLSELWRRWWASRGIALDAKNSAKNYRRCEALSRSLPDHPSPGDVVLWLGALAAGGLAPGTVAMHRDILHGLYSHGQAAGWATTNPVALAPWRRPPPPAPHPIRNIAEVWPTLLAVAGSSVRERAFLGVLRFTGCRLEEALGLEPTDILTRSEPWRVSIVRQRSKPNAMTTAPTKGRRQMGKRAVPVRPELRALVEPALWLPAVQLRFGTRGMPRTEREVPFLFPFRQPDLDRLRAALGAVAPDAFGPGQAWHTFRHSLAFEMYAAGKPVEVISEVLGHESVQTTEHYLSRLCGNGVRADAFSGM